MEQEEGKRDNEEEGKRDKEEEGKRIEEEEKIEDNEKKEQAEPSVDGSGKPLFKMKCSSKKHWDIVQLVANKGSNMLTIKSTDAIKAFCLLCQVNICFSKGNGNSVYRHVEKHHKRKLDELVEGIKHNSQKKVKTAHLSTYFSNMVKEQDMKMASKDDQLHAEALIVKWVSKSLRPFKIVEDKGFVDICNFLSRLRGQFKVPSRTKTRDQMMGLSEYVMKLVKKNLVNEMNYYSLTTDIWSSRVMQSFMALTLHYLTENFELKAAVLEVKPLVGSHTGEFIAS